MIINVDNHEFLIEAKVYSGQKTFETGKKQLAYYADSLNLKKAVYLVFISKRARIPENVKKQTEAVFVNENKQIEISTYLIEYDKTKW